MKIIKKRKKKISQAQINDINDYLSKLNEEISHKEMEYKFFVENSNINVKIIDKGKINRRNKYFEKTYSYNINMFNNDILKIIKDSLKKNNFYNFEAIFLKNIRNGMESSPSKEYIDYFKKILKIILKSKAARNYFDKYYKFKNTCNNVRLNYHFDRDDVIEEIFKRMRFSMIYKDGDQAYTSPYELKIFINCIPGQYANQSIHLFERKILQFSRLITITTHEILGHFLRRYYSFLTNNLVKLGTKEDTTFQTGIEGGKFVELNFLGLFFSSLSLLESIGFFKDEFNDYPILFVDRIDKKELRDIIVKNPSFFDFITLGVKQKVEKKDDKKDGKKDDQKDDKLTLNEFHSYLLKGFQPQPRIYCGNRVENVILLEHQHFLE